MSLECHRPSTVWKRMMFDPPMVSISDDRIRSITLSRPLTELSAARSPLNSLSAAFSLASLATRLPCGSASAGDPVGSTLTAAPPGLS